ncbi:MAG: hypothetical protein JSU84_07875 [Thiotrichales bacterium]|nr:MAG: hypothetical protein JSU84_07875 [Thiotrichales bacterium]
MSETDRVKEEIGFYKTAWSLMIAALFALVGWYVLYDQQDVKSGLALVAIVILVIAWLYIQAKIFKLLDKLEKL